MDSCSGRDGNHKSSEPETFDVQYADSIGKVQVTQNRIGQVPAEYVEWGWGSLLINMQILAHVGL